jgi:hypothetical protein
MDYRYHPEIEGLKVNEDGSEVLLNETPVVVRIRKSGNHPFRFITCKSKTIGMARLILECWQGMPPIPRLTAKHKDGDYGNYHYKNLEWGNIGGNPKNPSKLPPNAEVQILRMSADGMRDSEIAKEFGVSRNAIHNLKKRIEKRENGKNAECKDIFNKEV